jgi:hypothetical protein
LDGRRERGFGDPVSKSSCFFGADVDGEETEFVRDGPGEEPPLTDGVGDFGGEAVSTRGEGGGVFRLSFMGECLRGGGEKAYK